MALVTRGTLKTRIIARAKMSGYVDTSVGGELETLINTSIGKLHNLLAGELYEDYFIVKGPGVPLQSGVNTYPLPSDFMKHRALWFVQPSLTTPNDLSQGIRQILTRLDITEQNNVSATQTAYPGAPYGYTLEGRNVVVSPMPNSTANFLQFVYIPQYTPPVSDDTALEYGIAFGWDEWVVADVIVQIRLDAMLPTGDLAGERDKLLERIRLQAKNRSASDPPKVRNTGWNRGGNGGRGSFAFKA